MKSHSYREGPNFVGNHSNRGKETNRSDNQQLVKAEGTHMSGSGSPKKNPSLSGKKVKVSHGPIRPKTYLGQN